jgi:hypothetical protein
MAKAPNAREPMVRGRFRLGNQLLVEVEHGGGEAGRGLRLDGDWWVGHSSRVKTASFLLFVLSLVGCGGEDPPMPPELEFTVVTFNTGTTETMGDARDDDDYSAEQAMLSDLYYGDGLAWVPAVEAATAFLADTQPDIIAFQEIFYSGECEMIPPEAQATFVCETWAPGDPTVANVILGAGYQVACNLEKPDKCMAVKRSFGTIRGCDSDLCLDFLEGSRVPDCGSGSRVGRARVDLVAGGTITVVAVHGSSGITLDDMGCREQQFDQVFVDLGLGDGEPAANGTANIILGDMNTDPVQLADGDTSAARFSEFVGEGKTFHFINDVGRTAPPTYAIFHIDHIVSDVYDGECEVPGVTDGIPDVIDAAYFDHKPIVCHVGGDRPD